MQTLKILIEIAIVFGGMAIFLSACSNMGKPPSGSAKLKLAESQQWNGETFANPLPQKKPTVTEAARHHFFGGSEYRDPKIELPIKRSGSEDFKTPPESGLRVTWLGHSSLLVEIDGKRILTDPVWSRSVSPIPWLGGKRYHDPPIALSDLPPIDAVVISHDHYDHLDMPTVKQLSRQAITWIVPLGVGSHLKYWGIEPQNIIERDWWQSCALGDVTVTATPARHSSCRSFLFSDVKATLWAGWAFNGPRHAVFFSGDTSLHNGFKEIGERLGPFDMTLMENGAYDPLWSDSHMGPEQAIIAHQLVRGKILLPIHWGTFPVGTHGWTEPAERILVAAKQQQVSVAAPVPGESISLNENLPLDKWWPSVPWKTAEEKPVWSSGVDHLTKQYRSAQHPKNLSTNL